MITDNKTISKGIGFSHAVDSKCKNRKHIYGNNIDELVEAAITLNDCNFILDFIETFFPFLTCEHLKLLEPVILKDGRFYLYINHFATLAVKKGNYDFTQLENLIIESASKNEVHEHFLSYIACVVSFATIYDSANIDKLQDIVIESRIAYQIYNFAHDVKGADINKLYDAILKTNNLKFITKFKLDILHKKKTFSDRIIMFWYE